MAKILIVELAGPAGAGKTTIRNALSQSKHSMRFGPVPQIKDIRNLPFFLWNWILLLPVFFAIYRDKKQASITLPFMVRMAILNGWARQLSARQLQDINVLILDQGPVYMLAELLRHGPVDFRQMAPAWWERVCQDWANTLDMVICLDTPDDVLLQRIRTREKNHGIKKKDDQLAAQFLTQCRVVQAEVLNSMIEKSEKVDVIQMDTSQFSVPESVQKISNLLFEKKKTK